MKQGSLFKIIYKGMALLLTVLLAMIPVCSSAASGITVLVEGKSVVFTDAAPFIDSNGRILAPVKYIGEALGAKVSWDGKRTATLTKGSIVVSINIGENNINVNGTDTTMDTMAVIFNSRTYVPIRFIAQGLGAKIGYDTASRTASITLAGGTGAAAYTPNSNIDNNNRIVAKEKFSLVIKDDNTLWGWGYDDKCHFGLRFNKATAWDSTIVVKPAKLMDNVKAVYSGDTQTLVIKTDGTLWGWGNHMPGVGEDRLTFQLNPVQITIPNGQPVISAAVTDGSATSGYDLIVTADGKLWALGQGFGGYRCYRPSDKSIVDNIGYGVEGYHEIVKSAVSLVDLGMNNVAKVYPGDYALKTNGDLVELSFDGGGALKGQGDLIAKDVRELQCRVTSSGHGYQVYFTKTTGSDLYTFDPDTESSKAVSGFENCSQARYPFILKNDATLLTGGQIVQDPTSSIDPKLLAALSEDERKALLDNLAKQQSALKGLTAAPFDTIDNIVAFDGKATVGGIALKRDGSVVAWGWNCVDVLDEEFQKENKGDMLAISKKIGTFTMDSNPRQIFTGSNPNSLLLSDYITKAENEKLKIASAKLAPYDASFSGKWGPDFGKILVHDANCRSMAKNKEDAYWAGLNDVNVIEQNGKYVIGLRHEKGAENAYFIGTADGNTVKGIWGSITSDDYSIFELRISIQSNGTKLIQGCVFGDSAVTPKYVEGILDN